MPFVSLFKLCLKLLFQITYLRKKNMNSLAMDYEYFIRRVYQVGRYGVDGANADDFRDLEHARSLYLHDEEAEKSGKSKLRTTPTAKLKKEYEKELKEVAEYVRGALRVAALNFASVLSDEELATIDRCKKLAATDNFEKVCEAMKTVDAILISKKIYPKQCSL
jgi:hypothetical protein